MDKTLIILLMFTASVTQNSVVLSSKVSYGLSEDRAILVRLSNISSNYHTAFVDSIVSNGDYFRALEYLSSQLSSNHAYGGKNNIRSIFVPIFEQVGKAFSVTFDTIALLGGKSCAEKRNAQDSADLEESIEAIISTLELAEAGSYSKNEALIKDNKNTTRAGFLATNRAMYNLLHRCTTGTGSELQDLIETVLNKVAKNWRAVVDSFYTGAKIYGSAVSHAGEPKRIAAALDSLRTLKHKSVAEVILVDQRLFALFETTSIYKYLNGISIVKNLYKIQLSAKYMAYDLVDLMEIIFIQLTRNLLNYSQVLEFIGPDTSGLLFSNATIAVQGAARLRHATENFFDTAQTVIPESIDKVTAARELLPEILEITLDPYEIGVRVATNGTSDCAENLLTIRAAEDAQNQANQYKRRIYFSLLVTDAATTTILEAGLPELGEDLQDSIKQVNPNVFGAMELVSKINCAKKTACEDNIHQLESYRKQTVAAVIDSVDKMYHALRFTVLANEYGK